MKVISKNVERNMQQVVTDEGHTRHMAIDPKLPTRPKKTGPKKKEEGKRG